MPQTRASARTRVFIVDDVEVVLDGLRALLGREADLEVVGQAISGEGAFGGLEGARADVVVVDLSLPDLPGDEVIRRIARRPGSPAVLAHALHDTREWVRAAIVAGASGYLSRSAPRDELAEAVRALARGQGFVSPSVAPIVLALARSAPTEAGLSATDRAVLHGIALGERSAAIAKRLGMSARAVEAARRKLRGRLGARTTADFVRFAIAAGLRGE